MTSILDTSVILGATSKAICDANDCSIYSINTMTITAGNNIAARRDRAVRDKED